MSDLRLYSVNWQDGMLITRRHLRDQEKYFQNLTQWHVLQIGDQYGLVRKSPSGKTALSLNMAVSGRRLRVQVVQCQAITPDGSYIDINSSASDIVRGETEISDPVIPLYIAVDHEIKKEVGQPDPGEDPPRLPYLSENYTVHLGTAPNMPEGAYLQVAKLAVNGGEVSMAPDYFPPCLSVNAEEHLAEKASDLRNRLENLLSLSTRAYMAIAVTGALKGESTTLQTAFKEFINLLIAHLAGTVDDFVVGLNAVHPLQMVTQFKKLFRVTSTLVRLHPGLQDYLNERYFTREEKSDIGQFLAAIDNFLLESYNHRDLGGQIRTMETILGSLRGMVSILAQSKREELGEQAVATETLTYAGRTYRNVVYGATKLEQVGELCYLLIDVPEPRPMSDSVALMSKTLFNDAAWRSMQVRLGLNGARGLGETDPVDVDTTTFGNKVALHPRDMLTSSAVRQMTLIFRGAPDASKFAKLGKLDFIIYAL